MVRSGDWFRLTREMVAVKPRKTGHKVPQTHKILNNINMLLRVVRDAVCCEPVSSVLPCYSQNPADFA